MLLFSGHHKANQGAVNSFTTEFIESSIVCSMVACSVDIEYFHNYTIKQKQNIITTICDSLNIDIHFSISSKNTYGSFVFYQLNNEKSKIAAEVFQKNLNKIMGISNKAEIGYYHGKQEYGLDYFLKTNIPSIVVNIEHWNNYKMVKDNVDKYINALSCSINELITG